MGYISEIDLHLVGTFGYKKKTGTAEPIYIFTHRSNIQRARQIFGIQHADVVSRGQNREQDAKMRREVAPKWSGRPLPPVPHLQPPAQRTKGLRGSPGSLARSLR